MRATIDDLWKKLRKIPNLAFILAGFMLVICAGWIGYSSGRSSRDREVSALRDNLAAVTAERDDYRERADGARDRGAAVAGILAQAGRDAKAVRDSGSRIIYLSRGIREALSILDPGLLDSPIKTSD